MEESLKIVLLNMINIIIEFLKVSLKKLPLMISLVKTLHHKKTKDYILNGFS